MATALPAIASELGNFGSLPWVATVYSLTTSATLPVWGKLSDIFGISLPIYGILLTYNTNTGLQAGPLLYVLLLLSS